MRVAIIGFGGIGHRHLENLQFLVPDCEIVVLRRRESPAVENSATVHTLAEVLRLKPRAAVLSGPASHHVKTAIELAEAGIHLFIEKPLSNSLKGTGELLDLCRKQELVAMVGYNMRFHEPLTLLRDAVDQGKIGRLLYLHAEVGQYLPDWRPDMDYRSTVSARRKLGGGAMLELSHEIDLARWIGGEVRAVTARADRIGHLEIDVEDLADMILDYHSGSLAHVHVDMLQRVPRRRVLVVGEEGSAEWDMETDCTRVFDARVGSWEELHPAGPVDRNRMYLEEMRHFLDCVREAKEPTVGLANGIETLRLVMASWRSAETGRTVEL